MALPPSKMMFCDALKVHRDRTGITVTEIARASGVSRDVINKLLLREGSATAVENGVAIAAAFGLTLDRFLTPESADQADISEKIAILPDEDQAFIRRYVDLALHARQAKAPSTANL